MRHLYHPSSHRPSLREHLREEEDGEESCGMLSLECDPITALENSQQLCVTAYDLYKINPGKIPTWMGWMSTRLTAPTEGLFTVNSWGCSGAGRESLLADVAPGRFPCSSGESTPMHTNWTSWVN